jgi:hypothetical protein
MITRMVESILGSTDEVANLIIMFSLAKLACIHEMYPSFVL